MQRVFHYLVLVVLFGGVCYQAGAVVGVRLGGTAVAPPAPVFAPAEPAEGAPSRPAHDHGDALLETPLFDVRAAATPRPGKATPAPAVEGETYVETSLPLRLTGTVALGNGRGFAVIEDTTKNEQTSLRVGDEVAETGALLASVHRRRVLLERDGAMEALTLMESETPRRPRATTSGRRGARVAQSSAFKEYVTQAGENRYIIDARARKEVFANLPVMMREMALTPHMVDGQASGFRVKRIRRGSIYNDLGLEIGDVIQGINGRRINKVEDAMWLFQNLKDEPRFELTVARDGGYVTLNYEVR